MAVQGDAVRVDGLRELRTFMRKFGDDLDKQGLKDIHGKVAEPVAATAKTLAPRRSGRLAGSIRTAKGSTKAATVRAGGARVPYAGVHEFGWPNRTVVFGKRTGSPVPIREKRFLRGALQRERGRVTQMYDAELARFMAAMMRRHNVRR